MKKKVGEILTNLIKRVAWGKSIYYWTTGFIERRNFINLGHWIIERFGASICHLFQIIIAENVTAIRSCE